LLGIFLILTKILNIDVVAACGSGWKSENKWLLWSWDVDLLRRTAGEIARIMIWGNAATLAWNRTVCTYSLCSFIYSKTEEFMYKLQMKAKTNWKWHVWLW